MEPMSNEAEIVAFYFSQQNSLKVTQSQYIFQPSELLQP